QGQGDARERPGARDVRPGTVARDWRTRPMRRVLILHVGPHKTGTSYIQQRLVADRDLLLERAKVVYPKTGQDILYGHHSLATMFRDASPRPDEIRSLRQELSTGDTGLPSCEGFCRLRRAQFRP